MNINIYHQFDPDAAASGGIGKFVLNLVKEIPSGWSVTLVCCSSSRVGEIDSVAIYGKTVKRVFVLTLKDENKRRLFPITLSYLYGLFKYRSLIPKADIHFIQRLEYAVFVCAEFSDSKKCVLFHNDYENILDPNKSESYWARFPKLYMSIVAFFVKKLDLVLTVNTNTKNLFDRYLKRETVQVIPTWPDRDKFFIDSLLDDSALEAGICAKFDLSKEKKYILFVGRLQSQKNPALAIELMQHTSSAYHLLIAGDGNMRAELENYCLINGLHDKVSFLGNVSQADLVHLYNRSFLYLSTSHFEGMSVALLEALACGLPAITTPTGESRSIIVPGVNGVVTSKFDVNSILEALEVFESHQYDKAIVAASISKFDASELINKLEALL